MPWEIIAWLVWGVWVLSWWLRRRSRRNRRKELRTLLRRHVKVQVFVPYQTVRKLEDSYK